VGRRQDGQHRSYLEAWDRQQIEFYSKHWCVQAIAYREALDKQQIDTKSNTSMQIVGKKRFCAPEENVKR
jgi:hypothetical protein